MKRIGAGRPQSNETTVIGRMVERGLNNRTITELMENKLDRKTIQQKIAYVRLAMKRGTFGRAITKRAAKSASPVAAATVIGKSFIILSKAERNRKKSERDEAFRIYKKKMNKVERMKANIIKEYHIQVQQIG